MVRFAYFAVLILQRSACIDKMEGGGGIIFFVGAVFSLIG